MSRRTVLLDDQLRTDRRVPRRVEICRSRGRYRDKSGCRATGGEGSLAELNDTPKAAVRAAPIEGEADLAIQQKRPFASGKFQEIALGAQAESIGRQCSFVTLANPKTVFLLITI